MTELTTRRVGYHGANAATTQAAKDTTAAAEMLKKLTTEFDAKVALMNPNKRSYRAAYA